VAVDGQGRKIDTMLGEFRLVVPALGAIFGFQLVVAFQASFLDLPVLARLADLAGVLCTALAILFLLVPSCYHRFTHELDQSADFLRFIQGMISIAFVFIPLSLTLTIYVQSVRILRSELAAAAIAITLLLLLAVGWWLIPARRAHRLEEK
jgi:hypothetical protein